MSEKTSHRRSDLWPGDRAESRFQRPKKDEKPRRPGQLFTVFKAVMLLVLMGITAYATVNNGSFGEGRWLPVAIALFAIVFFTLFVRGFYGSVPLVGWALVGALGVLVGVKGLSMTWTLSEAETIVETIRSSMYLSFFLVALAALSSARQVAPMMDMAVLIVAAVAGYGLLQKVYPTQYPVNSLDGVRMDSMLGYSNTTAVIIAMGFVLALSRMTGSPSLLLRAIYSSFLLGFTAALYLTVSRGGIGSLVLVLVVLFALSESRLQMLMNLLLVLSPAAWLLWRMQDLNGLLGANVPEAQRVADGLQLRDDLIVAFIAAFVLQLVYAFFWRRYELMPLGRKALGTLAAAVGLLVVVAASVAAVLRYGGPARLYAALSDNPMLTEDGASRLLSLSIGNRTNYWDVAWEYWTAHPLTGSGAGTFSYLWLQERPVNTGVQQVHNLYLEQGVETGIVAFLALLLFVALLVGYTVRAILVSRGERRILLSGLLAAVLVYLISSTIEWHWYIPPSNMLFFVLAAVTAKFAATPEWHAPEDEPEEP